MSILISGVSMPKDGESFIIYSDGDVRGFLGCEPGTVGKAVQLPPHGRLIDADELKIYQMEEIVRADGDPNEYEYDAGLIDGLHMAAKNVSVALTVIPADLEKEEAT